MSKGKQFFSNSPNHSYAFSPVLFQNQYRFVCSVIIHKHQCPHTWDALRDCALTKCLVSVNLIDNSWMLISGFLAIWMNLITNICFVQTFISDVVLPNYSSRSIYNKNIIYIRRRFSLYCHIKEIQLYICAKS